MMRGEYPNQDHAQQPAAPDDKLTPGTDSKSDWFLSDFPSPSYKSSCRGHDFQSSNSEANCNYFSMSPRKGISITASETPSDSIPLEHHDRNMDAEEGQGGVPRTNTLPSRLSKATKICEKNVPLDTKYYAVEPENGKVHVNEPVGMVNDRINEDIAAKEVLIETFTGLAEFDGHEHVDSEFNEDDFSLHASLC
ncbi:hypothetical protein D8674_025124 [Pyrus ussuriensis x Pyrus communis]|uniref:Uncharacterized protein n=1 Tax=Pyrus ussuriensis x Pyrus communis TaxID=2448454 RepID=A0A5N5H9Y2_9ROSA|nr:hypothetical protein D8674_025124 [Pyrus ussuriensis x Pyrus communis]